MKLDNGSFLGRNLRRTGKFGIAVLSLSVGAVAFGAAYLATAIAADVWFPKLCLFAGLGSAAGVYALFERFDLIPDDPDKPMTLSLTERSMAAKDQPWISGDRQ
jgi:hypothetical protein